METLDTVLQAIHVGIVVAHFLLNKRPPLKAIELFKECLILLKKKVLEKDQQLVRLLYISVYYHIFEGYFPVSNYTSASIESGTNSNKRKNASFFKRP